MQSNLPANEVPGLIKACGPETSCLWTSKHQCMVFSYFPYLPFLEGKEVKSGEVKSVKSGFHRKGNNSGQGLLSTLFASDACYTVSVSEGDVGVWNTQFSAAEEKTNHFSPTGWKDSRRSCEIGTA